MRDKFNKLFSEGKIPEGVFSIAGEGYHESIYDIRLMIKTHLDMLDGTSSDRIKRPYRLRLERLYKQLNK